MLLSLEIGLCVGVFVLFLAGTVREFRFGKGCSSDRGRRTCADGHSGFPGTWEALLFPRKRFPAGEPGDQLQVRRSTRGDDGRDENSRVFPWYR